MNRRLTAKLNTACGAALVGALVYLVGASVQAAPLVTIAIEGRRAGTVDPWTTFVILPPVGDVVEYRLVADMAPVGTTNGNNFINSLINSGIQSLSLAIVQSPADKVQVDFNTPPTASQVFRNGWGDGTGASSGILSPRTPGGWNDVREIRPVQAPGVFAPSDAEVILQSGTLTITSFNGLFSSAIITPTWGTGSGAMRINGAGRIFITANDQTGADPLVAFQPLIIAALVPEPSTIVLWGMGLAGYFAMLRRRRSNLVSLWPHFEPNEKHTTWARPVPPSAVPDLRTRRVRHPLPDPLGATPTRP